ncbi:MAG TPA: diguanylate cyclase [Anaerolineales bacterium]|nr:diguanylate cyclase [Anaerolineales bacterium]HNF95088.1 diguanylate cyclase [Anaerolineales bacterium]
MNILVLGTDSREVSAIQQIASGDGNTVVLASSSAEAWQVIQKGGIQVLVSDIDATDFVPFQLISKVRTLKDSTYTLLITSRNDDGLLPKGDDILHRPYTSADLKNRIEIAKRFIALTAKLVIVSQQLENQAAFDPLTGFLNRAGFLRQATGELERSRRSSSPLCLIALDIDNFQVINDRFGSKVGDDVLEAVAKSIRDKSRPYDCIGRWTGDEFVIVIPNIIGADAEKVAERIIAGVRGTRIEVADEPPLNVKISAGIAAIMRITSTTEVEPLIQNARQALTRAKEAGGNQVYLSFL